MKARLFAERKARLFLLVIVVAVALVTMACEGTVYVGVAGPWGYPGPYGPYPPGGGVVVGYPY